MSARLAVSDKEDARAPTCLPISSRHAGQIIYFGTYRSLMLGRPVRRAYRGNPAEHEPQSAGFRSGRSWSNRTSEPLFC